MLHYTDYPINPVYLGNRMKRFLAFCIDIFPITFLVILVYRQFYEYDTIMEPFLADPTNVVLRDGMMVMQNNIAMIAGGVYLFYSFLMEASERQATFGKQLMRLKVIGNDGGIISIKEAFWRNAFKIISQLLFNLGFLWIIFDRHKRGWHDIIGKTLVVDQGYETETLEIQDTIEHDIDNIEDPSIPESPVEAPSINYNTLKEGNQTNLLFTPDIGLKEFKSIKTNHSNPKERLAEYKLHLVDNVTSANDNIPEDMLWNNSTYGQKLIRVFTTFDDHVLTDGLFYFLFYNNAYIYAMIDVLQEIGAGRILMDYELIVEELDLTKDVFNENRMEYESPLSSNKAKRLAFDTAHNLVPSASVIDSYYSAEEYQDDLYQQVCNYIEENPSLFI